MGDFRTVTVHTTEPECAADITLGDDGSAILHVYRVTPLSSYNKFGGTFTVTLTDNQGHSVSVVKDSDHSYVEDLGSSTGYGFSTSDTVTYTVTSSCTACKSEGSDHYNHGTSYTVGWHTHSAPSGVGISNYGTSTSSISALMSVGSWGCSGAGEIAMSINDANVTTNNPATWSGLTAGTTYTIRGYARNAHGYQTDASAISIRTRYATPAVSLSNYSPLNGNAGVSTSTTEIHFSFTNMAEHTGDITWQVWFDGTEIGVAGSSPRTGLTPGSTHTITVRGTNPDGDYSDSTITVRTRYNTPTVYVSNDNPYAGRSGVSASNDSITFSYGNTTADTGTLTWTGYYDGWGGCSVSPWTQPGQASGSSHTVSATAVNPDGDSASASMVIRVKYKDSDIARSITVNDIGLEHVLFTPSATLVDYTIARSYTIKNSGGTQYAAGGWNSGSAINTGYIFLAATDYTITIDLTMSATYDDLTVKTTKTFTTDAKCTLSSAFGNFNYCMPTEVAAKHTITNPSGNKVRCSLIIGGTTICTRDYSSGWGASQSVTFTDAEWDAIYKKMSNTANTLSYTWRIGTYSNKNSSYGTYYTDYTGTITLNGKKKTAHIGTGNHRSAVFIGVGGAVKRAVVWYGDANGVPHRCI